MDRMGMQLYIVLHQFVHGFEDFMEEERGAVDIVAIVVMIGVAVALALFFKDGIAEILETLFGNISGAAAEATGKI